MQVRGSNGGDPGTHALSSLQEKLASLAPRGPFGRAVAVLAGGGALGQAIALAASPALTRLYSPSDFGILAVYTAFVSVLGGLASLSYHHAIPLPESDAEAASVLAVCTATVLMVVGLVSVGLVFAKAPLLAVVDAPELAPWVWMIPIGVAGIATYEVLTQWAVRTGSYSAIARTAVGRALAQTATHLGMGLGSCGALGLLLGQLVGQCLGSGRLLGLAWREHATALRAVDARSMHSAAARYRHFPQYTTPAVLLNAAGTHAPMLILSYCFGGATTGLFALGMRLALPATIVAKSASQVFLGSAAAAHRAGTLGNTAAELVLRMLRIGAPFSILVGVAAPAVFALVFGPEWRDAGRYAQWLVPWLLLLLLAFPLTPLFAVLERQRAGTLWQAALLAARTAGLLTGGVLVADAELAVALFGVGSALCWGAQLAWLLSLAGVRLSSIAKPVTRVVLETAGWGLPIGTLRAFGAGDEILAAAFFTLCGAAALRLLQSHRRPNTPAPSPNPDSNDADRS